MSKCLVRVWAESGFGRGFDLSVGPRLEWLRLDSCGFRFGGFRIQDLCYERRHELAGTHITFVEAVTLAPAEFDDSGNFS